MPRQRLSNRIRARNPSFVGDPYFETVILLQSRLEELNRRLRQAMRESRVSRDEVQDLEVHYRQYFGFLRGRSMFEANMDLRLQVGNLRQHVDLLERTFRHYDIPLPVPFDRTFSSINL
jgi:hypothetical protein